MDAVAENTANTAELNSQNEPEILQNEEQTVLQNNSEADTAQFSEFTAYDAKNDELDAFIKQATATKDDDNPAQDGAIAQIMGQDEAAQWAVQGVAKMVQWAGSYTGQPLKIGQTQMVIFSTMLTPLVMKYGPMVERYVKQMSDCVEEDSYLPEMLAVGGTAGLAGSLYMQNRKLKKLQNREAANDGD